MYINESVPANGRSRAYELTSLLLLIVFLACLNTWVAHLYVASERFIFFWDWNGFIGITREFCEAFKQRQ